MTDERVKARVPQSVQTRDFVWLKALLTWVLLLGMFGVMYALGNHASRVAVLVMLGMCMCLVIVLTISGVRRSRRFLADHLAGATALARGDLATACEIYYAWTEQTKVSRIAAIAQHSLGWTLMRQARIESAIEQLANNDEWHRDGLQQTALAAMNAVDLAFCHALLDQLDQAEIWMAEAERRSGELTLPSLAAMKVLCRAVIDCRSDRCADAARMLDERWSECEATLTGDTLRPLKIVRAFAIAAAGPRSAGNAERIRPAYLGEFDFLGVAWPEMATFLETHAT